MKKIIEVSRITGVSVRTLQYYDSIGLLKPAVKTESGARLYDEESLKKLQQILLFRELEFPLSEIREILSREDLDRNEILDRQIEMLRLKKEHLEGLIELASGLREKGENTMNFKAFQNAKLEEYEARAREQWGQTDEYAQFKEKSGKRSSADEKLLGDGLMDIFRRLGELRDMEPGDDAVQQKVQELRDYITKNYYNCSVQVLAGLGQMYAAGGDFTENIDAAGGPGTGEFAGKAIELYCERND